jgi:hypothetical protein
VRHDVDAGIHDLGRARREERSVAPDQQPLAVSLLDERSQALGR